MIDDEYVSQYNTEDYEAPAPLAAVQSNISVKKLPMTTQLQIGSDTVSVINPEYVESLQRKLIGMENKFKLLEDELRQMNQKISKQVNLITRISAELDRKIDRG